MIGPDLPITLYTNMCIPLSPTKAPALAIAVLVRERGAAYSGEILNHFDLTEQTLRRRRSELRRLGIEFVRNGRGSVYLDSSLTSHFPATSLPKGFPGDDRQLGSALT
jgi:hypothetical protein